MPASKCVPSWTKKTSQRRQDFQCADRRGQSGAPLVPWRLELHDLANPKNSLPKGELTEFFMDRNLDPDRSVTTSQRFIQWVTHSNTRSPAEPRPTSRSSATCS